MQVDNLVHLGEILDAWNIGKLVSTIS